MTIQTLMKMMTMSRRVYSAAVLIAVLTLSNFRTANAQGKPFATVKLSGIKYEKLDPQLAGSLSFGWSSKYLAIGPGVGVTKFKGGKAYVPIFGEISAFNSKKAASPYVNFQLGSGQYSEVIRSLGVTVSTRGGLYFSPSVGAIFFQEKRHALIVSASYVSSHFYTSTSTSVRIGSQTTVQTSGRDYTNTGFGLNFGYQF